MWMCNLYDLFIRCIIYAVNKKKTWHIAVRTAKGKKSIKNNNLTLMSKYM